MQGESRGRDELTEKRIMGKLEKLNHKMKRQLAGKFQGGSPLSCVQAVSLHFIMTESRNGDVFTKDLEEFLARSVRTSLLYLPSSARGSLRIYPYFSR